MTIDVHGEYAEVSIAYMIEMLRAADGVASVRSYSLSESGKQSTDWDKLAATDLHGVFLRSVICQYSVSATRRGSKVECCVKSEADAELVLSALDDVQLVYAFAADRAEWEHRNRLTIQTAYGLHQAWVGMNGSLLPGLYWKMLLSRNELFRLGGSADKIVAEAFEAKSLRSGSMILSFYRDAHCWQQNAERLDLLCRRVPGLFSIAEARLEFEAANGFLEASSVLKKWQ